MLEDLHWEDTYAIAMALMEQYPAVEFEEVSLDMVYRWTISLPGFADDVELANDEILEEIYKIWLEERLEQE